jgi:16S rRNA (cytosine1402-N4)-methyltransferase
MRGLHEPVLLAEVLAGLAPTSGHDYLDGTIGSAGHAAAILEESSPSGRLLGLDRDPDAVSRATARLGRFGERARVVHARFDMLAQEADRAGFDLFHGVLLDLGISSDQLDDPDRGLSFAVDGPLDMRMDPTAGPTAADLVNTMAESDLADLIFRLGEEPRSRRIARAVFRSRPVHTTRELASIVAAASGYRGGRTHPATRTFQALRMAVNEELEVLERALPQAVDRLASAGRIAVISFHSLEDRLVKQTFRRLAADCICPPGVPECRCGHVASLEVITRRPITPTPEEVARNPRARSAKLRVAARLEEARAA